MIRAEENIRAVVADAAVASVLQVEVGSPLLTSSACPLHLR